MVNIPPIYGDDWGMVYYCFTQILGNGHIQLSMGIASVLGGSRYNVKLG